MSHGLGRRASRKLLFVAPSAYPLGGMQVWLDNVLEGLRRHGWQTELALVSGRFHDVSAYLAAHPFEATIRVAAPSGTREGRVRALRDCLMSSKPDVVVGVNIADVYSAAALVRAASAPAMKIVATLHALQEDFLCDFAANEEVIDAVVSTNRLAQKLVQARSGFEEERSLYAPYGVESRHGEFAKDHASGSRDRLRLAYVGRIENDQKRVRDLLLICSAARREGLAIELVVAGDGPDLTAMRRETLDLGLDAHVQFLGALDASEIQSQVYAKCDALVITSAWETGPIVAWEAMSAGLPLISSAYLGSMAERALQDGKNCLMFDVGDIGAAVDRIRSLLSADTRNRIVSAGFELVKQRYTMERSIEQWDAQLGAVMRLPPRVAVPLPRIPHSGRLDRIIGPHLGEKIRRWSGRAFQHSEPGGEWPHAYGDCNATSQSFWSLAQSLDRREMNLAR